VSLTKLINELDGVFVFSKTFKPSLIFEKKAEACLNFADASDE
jgi:hypothetical protein